MSFSPSGKFIGAAAMDDSHNIAVFEWQVAGAKKAASLTVVSGKGPRSPVTSLSFGTEDSLVCCAVKEMVFVDFS